MGKPTGEERKEATGRSSRRHGVAVAVPTFPTKKEDLNQLTPRDRHPTPTPRPASTTLYIPFPLPSFPCFPPAAISSHRLLLLPFQLYYFRVRIPATTPARGILLAAVLFGWFDPVLA